MKKHNIYSLIIQYKARLALCIILSLIGSGSAIIAPVYIGEIIDKIIATENIVQSLIILFVIYVINMIAVLFLNRLSYYISNDISTKLRSKLYNKLNKITLSNIDKLPFGDIINLFSVDIENIAYGASNSIVTIMYGITTMLGATIIMLRIDIIMAIIVLISAPIAVITSKIITNKTRKYYNKRANITAKLNAYTDNIVTSHKLIKDFNYEKNAQDRFIDINNDLYKIGRKAQFYSSLANPVARLISNLSYIIVSIFGIILNNIGKFTIGNISSFLLYTNVFSRPFNEITSVISEIQQSNASFDRICRFLDDKEEDSIINSNNEKILGEIEFKNIEFSYVKSKKFITEFNLQVKKGEKIAIVGKTGAGKTTIVNLLMRFYEINSGEILIDGKNIKDFPIDFLRKNIGMVLQDTKLFMGTIKENIAYGRDNVSDDEIIKAAKLSHADQFIERLPQGYDTYISNENMLSSGEVQLITIARIMLSNTPIVILDEATSNVDQITEKLVQKAFYELMNKDTTCFIIAHRLSTIENADKIIFIENGNIVEQGTHDQLMNMKGKYYDLYNNY